MSTPTTHLPNLGPDVDRGAHVVATYIVSCAISFIFVLLRFWARYRIRGLAADDWCMLASWVPFVPLTVLTCQLVLNGGTRHLPYLAAEDPVNLGYLVKINWIAQPFGIFSLGMQKVSISLLIARLIDRVSVWRKWVLHGISIWTSLNTFLMILLTFVQCNNARALWKPELKATSKCWDPSVQSNFSIYGSSAFCFTDFVLASMPLTLVWRLRLDMKKKVGLVMLLGCGALTGVCAAVKTSKLVSLASRSDLTWETYDLYMWTGVEIVLSIVCGSIPTLKPIYDLAHDKNSTSSNPSYRLSTAGSGRAYLQKKFEVADASSLAARPEAMVARQGGSEEQFLRPEPWVRG